MRSQDSFRRDIITRLFRIRSYAKVLPKKVFPHSTRDYLEVPVHQHQHVKMPTRKNCAACKGARYRDNPPRRVALAKLAANQRRSSIRRSSTYGCKQCGVNLCRNSSCFARYH
jgi:hypothetical protein